MLKNNDNIQLSNRACAVRKYFGEGPDSPIDIFALAQTMDELTLIFYPLGKNISGMCHVVNSLDSENNVPKPAVIAINSQMSYGRQRFTLAHELYHYFYTKQSVICPFKFVQRDKEEFAADRFASYLLLSQFALFSQLQNLKTRSGHDKVSLADVVHLEQYFGLSRQAVLYRLKLEGEITVGEAEIMSNNVIHSAQVLGYATQLYQPTNTRITLGRYIKIAEKLRQERKISEGKFEELLLEAYREDMVYGIETGGELSD